MKGAALFLTALVLVPLLQEPAAAADCAGVAATSTVVRVSVPATPCHWIFRADGGRDNLDITATVRDAAGNLQVGCNVTAEFVPLLGNTFACTPIQVAATDAAGVARFRYAKAGGCGSFQIQVRNGAVVLDTLGPFHMTSPDLSGDGPTNVIDLGIFADYMTNPGPCADYNCDGLVNIIDLGIWAGGLGKVC